MGKDKDIWYTPVSCIYFDNYIIIHTKIKYYIAVALNSARSIFNSVGLFGGCRESTSRVVRSPVTFHRHVRFQCTCCIYCSVDISRPLLFCRELQNILKSNVNQCFKWFYYCLPKTRFFGKHIFLDDIFFYIFLKL